MNKNMLGAWRYKITAAPTTIVCEDPIALKSARLKQQRQYSSKFCSAATDGTGLPYLV